MRRLSFVLVPSALLLAASAAVRAEVIEKVVAKVNGQIITLSEFQSRQLAAAQAARVDPSTVGQFLRQNNARILQDAIDELLIMQKAEDAGMKAPSQYVDEAIASIKKDNNLDDRGAVPGRAPARGPDPLGAAPEHRALDRAPHGDGARHPPARRGVRGRPAGGVREGAEATEHEAGDGDAPGDPREGGPGRPAPREGARREGPRRRGLRGARAPVLRRASRANGGDIGQTTENDMHPDLRKVATALPVGGVSTRCRSRPATASSGSSEDLGQHAPSKSAREKVHDRLIMQSFERSTPTTSPKCARQRRWTCACEGAARLTGPIREGSLLKTLGDAGQARAPVPERSPPRRPARPTRS